MAKGRLCHLVLLSVGREKTKKKKKKKKSNVEHVINQLASMKARKMQS